MNMKSLKMPRQLTLCIFIFSSVGNLAGKFVGGHILAMCTKPLIVPSLALFCWLLLKENDVRGRKVATLMLAMAFGALGDILLMFNGQTFFLAGLLAFLVGHIFYFLTIPEPRKVTGTKEVLMRFMILAILLAVTTIPAHAFDVKGFLGGCVVVYAGVFAYVINAVILAAVETKNRLYIMTLVGYVLFVISDAILAAGMFTGIRLPLHGFLVMLTYILAQFLIAVSLTKEEIRKHLMINPSTN